MGSLRTLAIALSALVLFATSTAALAQPTAIGWGGSAVTLRGQTGRFDFLCPPLNQVTLLGIWGTDIYSDDSPICVAALHAGAISRGGGVVTIQLLPGRDSYTGSVRNGVTSWNYGAWGFSYQVIAGAPADDRIDWLTAAQVYRGMAGQILVSCPPMPAGLTPPPIRGTDLYTDDSPICVAAVHSGVISITGGTVTIEMEVGQQAYKGSTRNGVTSQAFGAWPNSYRVTGGG